MTRRRCGAALALAVLGLAAPALIAELGRAGSATSSVQVTILQPTTVQATQDLDFGAILPPTEGSQTFVLSAADGTLTPGSGDGAAYGTPIAAQFAVTGAPERPLDVSVAVTRAFADAAITLEGLTVAGDSRTDGTGAAVIRVGGTLSVGAAAAPAAHGDAVITVTVNYQ